MKGHLRGPVGLAFGARVVFCHDVALRLTGAEPGTAPDADPCRSALWRTRRLSTGIKMTANPPLGTWNTPFGPTTFDRIRPEHFPPAFGQGVAGHLRESLRASPAVGRR